LHLASGEAYAQPFGQLYIEAIEQCRLGAIGLDDAAQPRVALWRSCGRQDHVGAADGTEFLKDDARCVAEVCAQDFVNVLAGVEPALLEAVVIGLGIRRQRQEVHHQALFPGTAALGDQPLGVIRFLDVLVTTIAACVTGDELVVDVEADPVGIGFDGHPAVSVCGGDGILIGIQGDVNWLEATLVDVCARS
jgi:hypothetical protein